jgi:hypothetical protein
VVCAIAFHLVGVRVDGEDLPLAVSPYARKNMTSRDADAVRSRAPPLGDARRGHDAGSADVADVMTNTDCELTGAGQPIARQAAPVK